MLIIRIPGRINPDLSPNAHKHWRTKHRAQQAAHQLGYYYAQTNRDDHGVGHDFAYDVEIGLAKGEKRKDDDNAAAMTKHFRDGIAKGMGCRDDANWEMGTVTQVRDPEGYGYIEFRLRMLMEQEAA